MNKELIVEALSPLFKDFEFKNSPIEVAGLSFLYGDSYIFKVYATWLNDLDNYSDRIHTIAIDLFSLVHSDIICKINRLVICENKEEIEDLDIIYQYQNN